MTPETAAARLARAEKRVHVLERLLEDKSRELYDSAEALARNHAQLEEIFAATPVAIFVCDPALSVTRANLEARQLAGCKDESLLGHPLGIVFGAAELEPATVLGQIDRSESATVPLELTCRPHDGRDPFPMSVVVFRPRAMPDRLIVVCKDLERERQLERELRQSQKLEAVGQLAAGVAHEINTPIQFVSDSLYFLRDAFADLIRAAQGECSAEEADLPYLVDEVPQAVARCEEGVGRVAEIVRALKELSHPDSREKASSDLNRACRNASIVTKNETKNVADVLLELGDIPEVPCHLGDVSQVLINLVVNAAHAIEDRIGRDEGMRRGSITISTAKEGDFVRISVADDGGGIPEAIRERIFEPFFTTKAVGRGTGQGLAIARGIVVDRHGGTLEFDSEVGRGTTFHVRLPVQAVRSKSSVWAADAMAE